MERLREDLSSVLEELRTQELKRFVFRVESAEWRHQCAHIPKGLFEKAGNEIWEIVHLMIGYYGEKTKDVALDALEAIGRRDLVKSFEDACTTTKTTERRGDYIKEYREEIKRKYEHIHKDTFLPEERVAFNSQYTNLTFIKKRQKLDEKEEELKARGDDLVSLMKKHRKYNITINEIFSIFENDDDKREPRTVVIQGPAGIGKTFTVHKIMLDWASGELFQDRFDFVFHLCCRELRISDHESLQELIIKCFPILEEALEEILLNPERILFIFDGLDELAFSEVTARDESAVKFLLTRKILPQASVLITTRPTALSVLKGKIDRYIEIVGFLEDGIMDYFLKSFKDQEKALTAFNVIKGNTVVLSMCFVPMVCWIICSMMKENEEDREDLLKNVTNASQILLHFINTLLEHHLSVSGNSDFLQNVCRLAYHGICEKKTMFKEDELSKFFITTTGSESTFFSKTLFKRHLHVKAMYHFLHLSIQELLAALYCASKASNEETEKLLNDSLSLEQGNLIHVVRFLFGLANETSQEIIEDLDIISLSIEKTTLQSWFSRAITQYKEKYSKTSDQASNHFLLQLLYCLFEMQDAEFATQAMKEIPWIDLSGCLLNRVDCTVIKYCIECSEHIQNLDVYRCNLDDVTVKILCEILPKCLSIKLHSEKLTEETLEYLCENLTSQHQDIQLSIWELKNLFFVSLESSVEAPESRVLYESLSEESIECFSESLTPHEKNYGQPGMTEFTEESIEYLSENLTPQEYWYGEPDVTECTEESIEYFSENLTPQECNYGQLDVKEFTEESIEYLSESLISQEYCYGEQDVKKRENESDFSVDDELNDTETRLPTETYFEKAVKVVYCTELRMPTMEIIFEHPNKRVEFLTETHKIEHTYLNNRNREYESFGFSEDVPKNNRESRLWFCEVSDSLVIQTCRRLFPKVRFADITLCSPYCEETVKLIIGMLNDQGFSLKRLSVGMHSLDSIENTYKMLSEDKKMKNATWELKETSCINFSYVKYTAATMETSVYVTGFDEYARQSCRRLIQRCKPTLIHLSDLDDMRLKTIIDILDIEDYTNKHLKIQSNFYPESSVENMRCILFEEEKIRNIKWSVLLCWRTDILLTHEAGSSEIREQHFHHPVSLIG